MRSNLWWAAHACCAPPGDIVPLLLIMVDCDDPSVHWGNPSWQFGRGLRRSCCWLQPVRRRPSNHSENLHRIRAGSPLVGDRQDRSKPGRSMTPWYHDHSVHGPPVPSSSACRDGPRARDSGLRALMVGLAIVTVKADESIDTLKAVESHDGVPRVPSSTLKMITHR